MADGGLKLDDEAPARAPAAPSGLRLPEHDVRRKRPPAFSFLLRMETLRRIARVLSLLVVDFAGIYAAILSALVIKAAVRDELDMGAVLHETRRTVAFAYLVTVLLFAGSSLYAKRAERPGLSRIVAALFEVMLAAVVFAVASGQRFNSYYIFYGSLFFATVYVGLLRFGYERVTGVLLRAAGYHRRAVLVGTGKHIEAVAHALTDSHQRLELVGYISLNPRPDNGLTALGS